MVRLAMAACQILAGSGASYVVGYTPDRTVEVTAFSS